MYLSIRMDQGPLGGRFAREKTRLATPWESWQPLGERDPETAREHLDPETFATAWSEGRAMTLGVTVGEALTEDWSPTQGHVVISNPSRLVAERSPGRGPPFCLAA